MTKYLIVGGVAGGATTAARLRRLDEHAEIIMLERGEYISYANCGLPYYIGDVIHEREKLFVQTPASFNKRFKVDVRVKNEAIKIDTARKVVTIKKLTDNSTYEESYDKLILSPGSEPIRPPIPGIDSANIFTLRNVNDTDSIKNFINTSKPKKAVIVGAGFIGLEMAENLAHLGIEVSIVEMLDQVMAPIDYEMAAIVHQHLLNKGVKLYLKDGVKQFSPSGNSVKLQLSSNMELDTDMVILSIGVKPDTAFVKDAGIKCTERGHIIIDEFMRTSAPDVFALGDAVAITNKVTGKQQPIPLAGPANRQGRLLADNLVLGFNRAYKGAIGTAIAKVFDLSVASAGLPEKALKQQEISYHASITHSGSNAGYYPGAIPLAIKIVFAPDNGKLLGAQVVGYNGVDARIDMLAAIISNGGTIYDLQEIEHAYAPPYSSAKDPVSIAGYVAENILTGRVKVIHWNELSQPENSNTYYLDVRTKDEFELGRITGAVNIPIDNLRDRLNEIPKDRKIVVNCAVGLRGYLATRILEQNGFKDVYNLSGGYKTYETAMSDIHNRETPAMTQKDTANFDSQRGRDDIKKVKITADACGLQCPGPIIKLKNEMDKLQSGDQLEMVATDQGFRADVAAWCNMTNNKLLSISEANGKLSAVIEKGSSAPTSGAKVHGEDKTIIVFSQDLDKALASFVIANGAAATGKKVTMFFTFWGLSVIKKPKKVKVSKDFMGKMFGLMLPRGSKKLTLSKMNMGGLGSMMMRMRMKAKNVDSLESMMATALANGVQLIACQMSMDIMGVKKEEFIDGVRIGGVATYLEAAEDANVNLFI